MVLTFSSAIRAVDYDAEKRELTVRFVTDRVYVYRNVPPEVHAALLAAESKGAFFNSEIRDHYRFREIE